MQKNSQSIHHNYIQTKSNGSRVGVNAEYNLYKELNWIVQIETAVDFDTTLNEVKYFSTRNTYIGLTGNWGRVIAGRNDTPLKMSQGNIDLFTDTDIQIYYIHEGDNRTSDTLIYNSKSFNSWSFNYALVNNSPKEQGEIGQSLSVQYQGKAYYFAFSYDKAILNHNIFRLVGHLNYQQFGLGAMLQKSDIIGRKTDVGYLLSLQYALSGYVIKAQHSSSDDKVEKGSISSLGAELQIRNNMFAYVFFSNKQGQLIESENLGSLGFKYRF
jgi:predicted porin